MTDYVNTGGIIHSGLGAWMARLMEVGITCPSIDHDVLNIVFKGRKEIVGQEWNVQLLTHADLERRHQERQSMRRFLTRRPRILHFAGHGPRPWKPVEMRFFERPAFWPNSGRTRSSTAPPPTGCSRRRSARAPT